MAIQNLFWGAMTPVAGAFADKYGSSRVLMVGARHLWAGSGRHAQRVTIPACCI